MWGHLTHKEADVTQRPGSSSTHAAGVVRIAVAHVPAPLRDHANELHLGAAWLPWQRQHGCVQVGQPLHLAGSSAIKATGGFAGELLTIRRWHSCGANEATALSVSHSEQCAKVHQQSAPVRATTSTQQPVTDYGHALIHKRAQWMDVTYCNVCDNATGSSTGSCWQMHQIGSPASCTVKSCAAQRRKRSHRREGCIPRCIPSQ